MVDETANIPPQPKKVLFSKDELNDLFNPKMVNKTLLNKEKETKAKTEESKKAYRNTESSAPNKQSEEVKRKVSR